MADVDFDSAEEKQQVLDSEEFAAGFKEWLVTSMEQWARNNPEKAETAAGAIMPLLRVLLSDAFAKGAKTRYQEEDIPLSFDEAVGVATWYMTWRLPYTGEHRPDDGGISYIRDYEIEASHALRENRLSALVEESGSNPLSYQALQNIVGALRRDDAQIPDELQAWIMDVAEGKRKFPSAGRGRSPYRNQIRDELIVRAVRIVVDGGLKATRNEASVHESACDAVSQALKEHGIELSYDGVAKVWSKGRMKPYH